ncbi:MAG: bifunctional adenosylcobinamide kinase/adenosylcobinamide-phosphate guanylyltransferase [Desulfamplus sp.]|nr:bifunctional adenosylcobinamide kinase/adenosylcobinamide-phosphate guanylyltransferase [Desulfamplus sp.]
MNNKITLVIGGCRSGKSSHALYLANQIAQNKKQIECNNKSLSSRRKIFMATSVPTDKEMDARVIKHQKERGDDWITAEVPVEVPLKIKEFFKSADVILVDCLTLWVSNLMFNNFDDDAILKITQELQDLLTNSTSPIFLVSNEVGMGVVPENALARRFRDMAGMVNQKIAQTADQVIYTVAGIPMTIKNR